MKHSLLHVGIALSLAGIAAPATAADGDWNSTLALGATFTSGNSETLQVNGSVTGEKLTDTHETRLGIAANYGESQNAAGVDETTTQNAKATANYKRLLGIPYLYSDNSLAHDDRAAVDYRIILGAGGGMRVVDTDAAKLGLELGVAYINEELATGKGDELVALRIAARHDQMLSETAKAWGQVEYLPTADDFDDYLLNAEAGVEAALNPELSLRVVVQDKYDSTVPAGREENDVSTIIAAVYQL